jgi:hypothetical protein
MYIYIYIYIYTHTYLYIHTYFLARDFALGYYAIAESFETSVPVILYPVRQFSFQSPFFFSPFCSLLPFLPLRTCFNDFVSADWTVLSGTSLLTGTFLTDLFYGMQLFALTLFCFWLKLSSFLFSGTKFCPFVTT